jgi:hypothetical protein
MKSVPNLVSYIHKFSGNFSQLLAIYFELFSFRSVFNLENPLPRGAHMSASFTHCVLAHTSEPFSHPETMQRCGKTTRRCGLILPFRTSFARPSGHSPDCHGCPEPSATVPFQRCQAEHIVFASPVGSCCSAIAGCSWARPLHHRRYFLPCGELSTVATFWVDAELHRLCSLPLNRATARGRRHRQHHRRASAAPSSFLGAAFGRSSSPSPLCLSPPKVLPCRQAPSRHGVGRWAMASVLSSEEMISGFVLVHHLTLKIHRQWIIAPKNIK